MFVNLTLVLTLVRSLLDYSIILYACFVVLFVHNINISAINVNYLICLFFHKNKLFELFHIFVLFIFAVNQGNKVLNLIN